jgi:Cu(I)-responsive transcriptional regulator
MNIGEASKASGVNQKMIRYYESIGLLDSVGRSANGYRTYAPNDIHTLAFIRRARHLGFSIEQIQALMTLWRDKARTSAEVKAIGQRHIAELQAKIEELASMQRTLEHLVSCCAGDDRPDCPIIDDLSAKAEAPAKPGPTRSNVRHRPQARA